MSEKEILKLIEKGVNKAVIAQKAGISLRMLDYRISGYKNTKAIPAYAKAYAKRLKFLEGIRYPHI